MRRFTRFGLVFLVLLSSAARAQTLPAFEFADVHTNSQTVTLGNGGTRGAVLRAAGRYEFTNATMLDLIRTAYGVDADKVLSGPSWLESDRFDIAAKAPAKTSTDDARLMLQALLADRFKLVVHKDTRPLPTYALSVAKGGAKLKETDGSGEPGCQMTIQQNSPAEQAALQSALQGGGGSVTLRIATFLYTCHKMTMAAFAAQMHTMIVAQSYINNNPAVDKTGLQGTWDFDFKYTQKPPANGNQNQTITTANGTVQVNMAGEYIGLFDAMEKQLGLKLDPVTAPLPVVIVDSVNRKPTDNPPDVVAKLPPPPTGEFEASEIRLSAPNAPTGPAAAPNRITNTQVNLNNYPLKSLIMLAWNLNGQVEFVGAPKWLDNVKVDVVAKMPSTGAPPAPNQGVDVDVLRPALKALLVDRFKLALHSEMRPGMGWVLTANKPKLAKADPENRSVCKEGPGKDGKDPRVANPVLGRLLTCQNMTMAQFAEQLPLRASGYFRVGDIVEDATGLTDAYDLTLSFSGAGLVPGGNRNIPEGAIVVNNGPAPAANASEPNGAVSLQDALNKQLGLKLQEQKRDVKVWVLDHIEEKPTD